MTTNITLTVPEKLRLRSAFSRWMKNPKFFSHEIAAAQQALNDAEKYGWKIHVDKRGVPSAIPAENMRLTPRELSRFQKRFATMNEAELTTARAALVAIGTRGYVARVDEAGMLVAVPPKSKVKPFVTSHSEGVQRHQRFARRFMGGSGTAKA